MRTNCKVEACEGGWNVLVSREHGGQLAATNTHFSSLEEAAEYVRGIRRLVLAENQHEGPRTILTGPVQVGYEGDGRYG